MSGVDRLAAPDECLRWYEAGLEHGIALGRCQVLDEWRGQMAVSAAIARMVADAPSFAELCERRGEPERAARQRHILLERGISA